MSVRKELCRFYAQNKCNRLNCPYVHKKPEACSFFAKGCCKYGDKCKFSHEFVPEKPVSGQPMRGSFVFTVTDTEFVPSFVSEVEDYDEDVDEDEDDEEFEDEEDYDEDLALFELMKDGEFNINVVMDRDGCEYIA